MRTCLCALLTIKRNVYTSLTSTSGIRIRYSKLSCTDTDTKATNKEKERGRGQSVECRRIVDKMCTWNRERMCCLRSMFMEWITFQQHQHQHIRVFVYVYEINAPHYHYYDTSTTFQSLASLCFFLILFSFVHSKKRHMTFVCTLISVCMY